LTAGLKAQLSAGLGSGFNPVSKTQLTQFSADFGAATLDATASSHDSRFAALTLESSSWSMAANSDIANSTIVPHLTIHGMGKGETDFYKFTITNAMLHPGGATAVTPVNGTFDMDHGFHFGDKTIWESKLNLYNSDGTLLKSGPGFSNPNDTA